MRFFSRQILRRGVGTVVVLQFVCGFKAQKRFKFSSHRRFPINKDTLPALRWREMFRTPNRGLAFRIRPTISRRKTKAQMTQWVEWNEIMSWIFNQETQFSCQQSAASSGIGPENFKDRLRFSWCKIKNSNGSDLNFRLEKWKLLCFAFMTIIQG